MKRVVVTGLGAVSPLGIGVPALWDGLIAGRSGVRRVQHFDTENLTVKIAAEVPDFDPKAFMDPKSVRRMDRFAHFAIAGTREALADAKLEISDDNRDRVAVVMNTGGGGIPTIESNVTAMAVHGPSRVGPLVIPMFAPNMASSQVSIAFGIHGPTMTSAAACASGVQAFVDAVRLLQAGEADVAVTGGTEAGITPVALTSLANMHALSRRNDDPEGASRPFDRERDGFVFGEGAGVLIIETEEHAVRRGATVYAEALGGALTSDAFHLTAPEPSGRGARMAMTNALNRAGMEPHEVDYIAAHATATQIGDIAETLAIKDALGDHAPKVAISANKSMIGHLLGAAGAISAVACVLAIRDGVVPPTINLDHPDPDCDLDYVPNIAREMPVRAAMVNGFGFGGQNASTIFRRFDE
ncbi:MAG TPA: beta-ketoacyl-ACP synthase II [Thermomicrobiales bacterium]|nr:beta-ketoacyl-ACP synthase II [Thermomicrobiales bacterium]